MLMHGLDDLRYRDCPGMRETLQQWCQAEKTIAMSVGDIDRGEVLTARNDPIHQSLRLLGREKGVRENGVALTVDERRGIRHPHQFFLACRQIPSETRALYREYIPLKIIVSSVGCTHRQLLCWFTAEWLRGHLLIPARALVTQVAIHSGFAAANSDTANVSLLL